MKVNIEGAGVVSGIGLLPVYGVELPEDEIKRLLNFRNIRVYDASNGGLITKKRFVDSKRARAIRNHNAAIGVVKVVDLKPTVVTPSTVTKETEVEPTPVVEESTIVETPIIETPVVEAPPVEEPVAEDVIDDEPVDAEDVPAEEPVVEETEAVVEEDAEEAPKYSSKKKKNRK